ncbi:tandem-95 repeat protein [Terasakiella sp.]|uniref:tandem-95 repeat protein n=1 Tax=Terasakiella sp. TaxID=2034861 RepID=UPI003AA9CBF3
MNFFDKGNQENGDTRVADYVVDSTNAEVNLPPSFNIATVQFDRAGPDLIVTSADGEKILVTNYFASGSQPAITLPNGVALPAHIVHKLAGPIAPKQVAQVGQAQGLEPIGKVETADGQVEAVRADGTRVTLKVGDPVFQGDELVTGGDGAVGIVFADETTFALGEDGRMLLDEMVYDPGAQDGQIGLTLLTGAMTFVSGAVAKVNPDAMQITTPVATIGIRGTAGVLKVAGETLDAVMLPELAGNGEGVSPNQANNGGTTGEFIITNNNGDVVTINQPFQGVTSTPNGNSAPRVFTMNEIGAMAGKTLSSLPNAENLLPPAIVAAATNEPGNEQQLNPEDVLVDNNTADALQDITQQTQSTLSNLSVSAEIAKVAVQKIAQEADQRGDDITKKIIDENATVNEQAQTLLKVTDNASTLSSRASQIENTAGTNSGSKDVEANAQRISVEWTSDTTDKLEDSVDNVAEAYATANSIGAIATGVSDFAYVVARGLKSFADPAAVVELVSQVDSTLADALNEAEYIVSAMTVVQDANSSNPDLSMSVKDRMVEAVIRAAKFVKDNGGTDLEAIDFAREVVVSGVPANGQMTFKGITGDVYKFYDGIKAELNNALTFSGHADAFTNLDSKLSTLNDLFVSLKAVKFSEGSAFEAKWELVVDELLALTNYTQTAATKAKAVVDASTINDMDQAATDAAAAQTSANSKVQGNIFNNLMDEMGDLIGTNVPSVVLTIANQFLSKANDAEIATDTGNNSVLNFFNRVQKDINENELAGAKVTQADIDAATTQLNEVKGDLVASKADLSLAQTAFGSAATVLSSAADTVVSALIAFKSTEAKRDVYIAGAEKINDGTLYNGTDHFNAVDGVGIDGLQEAKDFVSYQQTQLSIQEATYNDAVTALNDNPGDVVLARAVLVAQQAVNKYKTLIEYGNKLVETWQDSYDTALEKANSLTSLTSSLQNDLTLAENAEQTARQDLLAKLEDFITAQEDVSNESKLLAVFEAKLAALEARAEQEAKIDLDDAFSDARDLLDEALAQAKIASDKAIEADQKVQLAKAESDPTAKETLLSEAQTILSEAETAKNAAKNAFDYFSINSANSTDDNVLARAIDVRDNYPRPPSEIDQVISSMQSLQTSAESAYNEALKQFETAGHSVDVIQAIVNNDAAAQAAAEQAAQAAADAAKTQALQAALEKAQAAEKDIAAALQEAQNLKSGADIIAQNSVGTNAQANAANQATVVHNEYDQIVAKQVLVSGDNNTTGLVEQVQAAQAAGNLDLARSLAETAQTYAKDAIAIVEGTTLTNGLRYTITTTAKNVITAMEGQVGGREVNSDGVETRTLVDNVEVSSRTGFLKLSADQLDVARTEYSKAYANENDTTAGNGVESVLELFTPSAGQSIVSAILAAEVTADELSEFGGTDVAGYIPIYTRLENLKAAVSQSLTDANDSLTLTQGYASDSASIAEKARAVLDAANMKGTDFTDFSSKVDTMGKVSGMIADESGRISAIVQRIEQIQKALDLYDKLWDARVQAAKNAADAKAAAETAAQQASDDVLAEQQRREEQKQAEDEAATKQAKDFHDTALAERDLASRANDKAQEAAINGDQDSARQYLSEAQDHTAKAQSAASAATDAASGHGATAEGYAESAREYYETASGYVGDAKAAVSAAGDATTAANNWRSGAATTARIQAEADKTQALNNESAADTALSNALTKLTSARTALSGAEVDNASAQAAYNSLVESEKTAKDKAAAILAEVGGNTDNVIYQAWEAAYQAAVDATKNAQEAANDAAQALSDATSRVNVAQTAYDNAFSAAEQASEQLANAVSDAAFASSSEQLGRAVSEAQVEYRLETYHSELDSALSKIDTQKQNVDTLATTAAQNSNDLSQVEAANASAEAAGTLAQNAYDDPNSTNDAVGTLANAQQVLASYHVDIAAANADMANDNTHTIKDLNIFNNDATWIKINATTVIHSSTYEKYLTAQKSVALAEQKEEQAQQALHDVQAKITEIAQSLDKAKAIAAENALDNATQLQQLQDGADAALARAEGSAENAIDSAANAISAAKNALGKLTAIVGNNTDTLNTDALLNSALQNIGNIQTIAHDWGTSEKAATSAEIANVINAFGDVNGAASDLLVQLKNALNSFNPANFTGLAHDAALQVQSALQALVNDGVSPTGGAAGFALSAVNSLSNTLQHQVAAQGSGATNIDSDNNGIDDGLEASAKTAAGDASSAADFAQKAASQTAAAQGANKNVASIQSDKAQADADAAARTSVEADLKAIVASANAADSAADQAETDKATAKAEYDQAVLDVATAKAHKEALESIAQFSEDAQNPITDLASKAAVLNELNDAKLAYQAALKASAAANIAQKATSDAAIAARAASDNIIAEAKKVALILDPSLPDSTDFVSYLNTYVTNNSAANLNASFFVDDTSTTNVNESDLDGDGISNVKEISNARTETGKQEDTALKQQNIASTQKDKAAADQSEAAQSATNAQGDLNDATASRAIFDKSEQIADKLEQANTYASGADANAQAAQTAAAQAKAKSQVAAEKTTDVSLTDAEKIAQARLAANETHAEQVKAETSENSALGNFNLAFAALIAAYDVIGDPNSQLNSLTSAYTNMADAINAHSATDSKTVDSATNTGLETAETNAINAYDTAFKAFVADLETELDARVTNQDANTLQKDLILNAKSAVSDAFDSLKGSVESHATATKSAINAEVTADQAETNISNAIQTAVNAYQAEADASAKQAEADAAKASAVHDDNNAQTSNDASAIDTKIQSLTGSIQTRLATLENDLLANQNALGNDLYTSLKTQLDTLKAAVNAVDSKSTQITGDVSTAADAASTAAQNARSYADATVAGNDLATAKNYATQAATYAKEAQNQLNIAQAHRSKLLGVLNDATALEQGYTQLSNVIDAKVQLAQAEADVNSTPIAQDDAFSTDEDQSVNLNDHLLANDYRNDGQPVQILDVGTPNVGTIVKNAQGEYIFTPPQDYSGEVRFSYLITTDNEKIASANVVMTITSVNDAPIAVNDVASTINETSPVTINLLANDINVDAGDILTVTSIGTQPVYGTLTILNNGVGGRVIYTPDPNNPILKALGDQEVKEDTFTYVVTDSFGVSSTGTTTVTINGTNDLPTVSDTQLSVDEDVVHTFSAADFQAGFNDVDGDSLAAIRITQLPRIAVTDEQGVTTFIESGSLKLNGTAVTVGQEIAVNQIGNLTFQGAANYHGTVTLGWQASDGAVYDVNQTVFSENEAVLTFNVNSVNDPVVITSGSLGGSTAEDTVFTGTLSATDVDGDSLTYSVDPQSLPANGNVTINPTTGQFTYTPNPNYNGSDSFVVMVSDGQGSTDSRTVNVYVSPVNDAPTDISLDKLTVDENADGAVIGVLSSIDPDSGNESFTYTVSDSRFEVVGSQLKLKAGQVLNYENPADQNISLSVTTQDSGGLTYSENFTISTQNQNEAPTDIILSNLNVAEDTDGAVVGQLSAIDPDNAQETFTYTVDDPRFEVVGNELKLKAGYTLDYENPADQSFQINVSAQDSTGLTYTETFTLSTQNTLDMPVVSGLASEVVSLSFDGVSTIVDVGRGSGDSLELTDDLTLETWVKFNQVVGEQTIVAFGGNGETSSTNIAYQLYLDATGDIHYKHEYGAGLDVDLSFDTNLTQGNWHHLAVVRDNNVGGQSDVTLYVDGVSVGTLSYDGASQAPASAADATMTVGNTIDETSPLNGEITEARIWSDIRSESEIQTFMKEVLPQSEISDPTLRGYWDFAGLAKDDSEYLKDLSTYQNHIVVFDGLHFDGSVTATSYSGITLAGHSASVWARVEPISDGMTDGDVTVFSMNDGTSTLNMYLSTYGEITLDLTWAGGSHSWAVDSGAYPQFAGLDDGQWHNLGYSFDPASGVALFVDGQQVPSLIDSGTGDYSTFVIDSMVMIGGHSSNSALNMVGDLSELGIYNRVLTHAEMQEIVENGPHNLSSSDVAAYWHMDDGDGSYISYDSFGDMNDIDLSASISGTPVWINETPGLIDYPYQSVEVTGTGLDIGSYTFNSNEFSASMWVKVDDVGNGTELLMLGDGDITVTAYNDYIEVVVGNSIYATVYNAMEIGEWSNLSVTFDGNELKVYSGDNLFYNEPAASYYDLLGGLGSDTFGGILGGVGTAQFGAVQIWNSVLDQQDIMAISNGGVNPSDPNLLAYWPMTDDPATGMITDMSGHQNDVTLSASQFISGLPVLKTNATTIDLEEDDSFVSQILVENSEVYGDALSYQVQSQPQNGVVYINPDGSFVYVPNTNYVGTDTFSVVAVNAGSVISSPFTVNLNIVEHNAIPHVGFDNLYVLVNSSNNVLNVLANDYDQDGDPLTITAIDGKTGPGPHMVDGGTVTLVNGDVTFTPAYNFTGTVTFEYTVSDGQGGSHSNFVDVQVSATINGTDASETLPAGSDANEYFYAMAGDDIILGSGGDDYIDGGDGVDTVSYAGSTDGVHVDLTNMSQQSISLSQGVDTLYAIENVDGTAFNDTLIGDMGANLLIGADGDDTLTGGGGADVLDAGNGKNLYIYSSATDSTQGAADVIKSLTPQDAIQFIGMRDMTFVSTSSTDAATFMAGGMAADTVYYVSVGSGDNFIYVNGAGTGTDYTGIFIVLDTGVPAPTAEQILADDYPLYVLQGTDGNETLTGDAAVNTLVGLLGNDTLQGADGDDHYIVSGGTDYVIDSVGINHIYVDEDAYFITNMEHTVSDEFQMTLSDGMGSHELIIDQHYTNTNAAFLHLLMDGQDNTYQIQTNVSIVPTVGSILVSDGLAAETLTGSSFDDILVGQTGDTLLGGGGYDFFVVNEGVIAVDGGDMASEDEVAFTGQTGGVLVDLENGFGKHSDGVNTFTISNVQNVTGSEYDDTIAGDLYDNYLWGYLGNDTLVGGDGNDTLEGGSGEDFLFGGNGNDVFEFFGSEDSDQYTTDIIADFVSGEDKISIAQSAENMKFYGSYGFVDDPAITLSTIESDPKVEPGQIVWFYSDNAAFVYVKNDGSQNGGTFIALVGYQGELSYDDFIGVGDNVVVDATSDIYESGINQTVVVSAAEFLGNDKGATLQITHVNGLAIADLQANGLHDASGVLSYDGANFTFVPTNEFSGDIHFDVTVAGTGGTDQANLTIRYDEAIAIVGTSGDDILGGSIYSDAMIGLDGDDQFYGGIGDDFIVGGGNTAVGDVAAYDQVSGDYSIGLRGSALVVRDDNLTDNDEGIDYLLGIEKIYFNDIAGSTPHGLSVTYEGDRTVDDTNVVADTVSEITYLSDGTYVTIHRQSSNDFLISRFNEDGTPFAGMPPFSIASGDAMPGETAMIQGLSNASFAVVWSSSSGDILYQRFDTSGAAIDPDPFFVSDSLTETGLERPEMVTLASNDVVVSYIATDVNAGFYMRTLPGDDVEANMGASVLLKSFNTVDETVSSLVALTGGGYAYAHTTDNLDGTYNTKVVVDSGMPVETIIASYTPYVDDLKVVELDNGNLLTVWKSELADGFEQTTIKARIIASDGSIITDTNVIGRDVFDVNFNSMDGGDYSPDVAVLSNGNFVVVWTDLHEDGDGGAIFGQIFDQDGNSVGEDFLINATTQGNQYMPSVAANDNGTFVVSWTDEQTDSNTHRVMAQQFANDGSLASGVTIAGDGTVDVFVGGDGKQVFVADIGNDSIDGSLGRDGVTYASFTEGVNVDLGAGQATTSSSGTDELISIEGIIGTSYNDTLIGDIESNKLNGMAGDDLIKGGLGDDYLIGGAGWDTVSFEFAGASVSVDLLNNQATGEGNDIIEGFESVVGSMYADVITGDGLDNVIEGGDGDDMINGGAGSDIITGGAGVDTLDGGAGNDYFVFNDMTEFGDLISTFESGDAVKLSSIIDGLNGLSGSDWATEGFEFGIHTVTDVGEGAQLSGSGPSIYVYANTGDDSGTIYYDADGAGASYTSTKIADIGTGATSITADAIKITY